MISSSFVSLPAPSVYEWNRECRVWLRVRTKGFGRASRFSRLRGKWFINVDFFGSSVLRKIINDDKLVLARIMRIKQ